jgi:hypothetical protein
MQVTAETWLNVSSGKAHRRSQITKTVRRPRTGRVCSGSVSQMTRDGCVVQLLVDVDENGVVFDLAGVNRDGAAGKHADGLAGGQVIA